MNLDIHTTNESEHTLINLEGELDAFTAPKLKEDLYALVSKKDNQVIVDLSAVNYMDSTGLGIFIGALKASKQYNSHIILRNPQERIQRLFSITGLTEVMEIQLKEGSK